jgi:hypothetical protein
MLTISLSNSGSSIFVSSPSLFFFFSIRVCFYLARKRNNEPTLHARDLLNFRDPPDNLDIVWGLQVSRGKPSIADDYSDLNNRRQMKNVSRRLNSARTISATMSRSSITQICSARELLKISPFPARPWSENRKSNLLWVSPLSIP